MYTILLIIIYLAFISLGLPDSILGSAWPSMQSDFQVPIGSMGIITVLIAIGTISSSLFSSKLNYKFGSGIVTAASVLLTSIAMFGFSQATDFYQICLFAIPYGLGAGSIDATLNNYVSLNYKSKHMSFLHAFWGIGTLIGPFAMSYALSNFFGWQKGYQILGIIQLSIATVLFISLFMWKKTEKKEENVQDHLNLFEVLKIKHVKYLLFGFLLYTGFEGIMINWTTTYLVETKGITNDLGALLASVFFIGMTSGRLISGIVSNKISSKNIIRVGYSLILVGVIIMLIPTNILNISLVGIVLCGLGAAPIFPSVIHSTPSNFDRNLSQSIISIEMAFAYTGIILVPPLFGLIANFISIELFPIVILCIAFSSFILIEILNKKVLENKQL